MLFLDFLLDQPDSLEDIRDVIDTPLLYVQGLCSSIEINRTLLGVLDEGYEFFREQAQKELFGGGGVMEGVSQRIEAERNQHNIILTVFASVCKRTYRNDKLILPVSA